MTHKIIFPIIALVICASFAIYTQLWTAFSPKGEINPQLLTGEFDPSKTTAVFNNKKLPLPANLEAITEVPKTLKLETPVLGEQVAETSETDERVIKIDLGGQRLFMFEWAAPKIEEGRSSIWASKDNPGTKVIIYGRAPLW